MNFGTAQRDFESVIFKAIRDKIRNGKIKLLRTYIKLLGCLRLIALGAAGFSAIVAIFVAGSSLALVGLLGLLPISIEVFFIILASLGGMMMLGSGLILFGIFREKNWLKYGKVTELMEMVLDDEKPAISLRTVFGVDEYLNADKKRKAPDSGELVDQEGL